MDFLRYYGFLIYIKNSKLIEPKQNKVTKGHNFSHTAVVSSVVTSSWSSLLDQFPDLTRPRFNAVPNHGVHHHIPTSGPPVACRPRRLSPANLEAAKVAFQQLLELKIVQRSSSSYQSPLVLVDKPDGSKRVCGDFTQLNLQTKLDRYQLPHIQDFVSNLCGTTIFSTIDLVKGFHQVQMNPNDVHKTAIATPFGSFKYLRMPYELKNSAQSFQRLMDTTCHGLDFAFVYVDDILVASKNIKEHKHHLQLLFQRLNDNGFAINPKSAALAKNPSISWAIVSPQQGLHPCLTRSTQSITLPYQLK